MFSNCKLLADESRRRGRRVTADYFPTMTRVGLYRASLLIFLIATSLTLSAIAIPRWISYHETTVTGDAIIYTYGLHHRCSSSSSLCTHFPARQDCHGSDRSFCSVWRSVGFLMSFAVVLEGVIITAFAVILIGGRKKREAGWLIMSFLLSVVAATQCASTALIAYLYDWDERFFIGWRIDLSWFLTTVSWSITVLLSVGLALSRWLLPPEDGYVWLN